MKISYFFAMTGLCLLASCSTVETNKIVMVGIDTYVVGGDSTTSAWSAKEQLIMQAQAFCRGQGKEMQIIGNMARAGAVGTYGSGEVQFKCIAPSTN